MFFELDEYSVGTLLLGRGGVREVFMFGFRVRGRVGR